MSSRGTNWTPDEIIVAVDLVRRHGWADLRATHPDVVELSALLRALPVHRDVLDEPAFRSPNSVSRKITDVYTAHPDYTGSPTRGGETTKRTVEAFVRDEAQMVAIAAAIRTAWEQSIGEGANPYDPGDVDADLDYASVEGGAVVARHLRRERDPKLRRKKIEAVLRAHGTLECEVCAFDFGRVYGDVGDGYIEVHHVTPLHASGETTTRLADLAMLCSNCHRMIHRRTPWLNPHELRDLVRRAG